MVSSITHLLGVLNDATYSGERFSNVYATAEPSLPTRRRNTLLSCLVAFALIAAAEPAAAQQDESLQSVNRTAAVGSFLGGFAVGLAAHEGGHLLFDVIFDADPGIKRVEYHGIPFFALTHKAGLPRHQEFAISSAGFWVQHGTNEWLLTRRPHLRRERAAFAKGLFAFNIGASAMYSIAAFAKTGPPERDTRGMAVSAHLDERWIGAMILAPALLDTWRYFDPDARWLVWASRAAKAGAVLLILR
jgi:hypothetical protein